MPSQHKLPDSGTSNSLVVPFGRAPVSPRESHSSIDGVAPNDVFTSEDESDEENERSSSVSPDKRKSRKRPLSGKVNGRGTKKSSKEAKRPKKSPSIKSIPRTESNMQLALNPNARRSVQSMHGKPSSQLKTRTGLTGSPRIILVLDTNILLEQSGLSFLESLTASYYDDLPAVQVHIPHAVLLELDRQKNRHNSPVQAKATQAIRFLHDEICDDIPVGLGGNKRIVGQTVREYTAAQENLQHEIDDDHILFCCLQMKEFHEAVTDGNSAAIWCLTNDKNLRIRCVFNGVAAYHLAGLLENIEKRRQGRPSIFDVVSKSMSIPGGSAEIPAVTAAANTPTTSGSPKPA